MRVLLDTSAFLWFVEGNEKLSAHARNIIVDPENQLILSLASLWEIAIKISLKKLELLRPYEQLIPQQLDENDINVLPTDRKTVGVY
jgi:PIN domain nuclease of toxin-antitoxin system